MIGAFSLDYYHDKYCKPGWKERLVQLKEKNGIKECLKFIEDRQYFRNPDDIKDDLKIDNLIEQYQCDTESEN